MGHIAQPSTATLSTTAARVNPPQRLDDKIARVVLVGCSKQKRDGRNPARELHHGGLFKAALARVADETFVVSALHGLVPLDRELDTYERTLRPSERPGWAYRVCLDLRQRMKRHRFAVTIFAGETYAEPLQKYFAALDGEIEVCTPLAGLALGYQLRWLRLASELATGAR